MGGGASREGDVWVAVTAISGTPTPANGIMKVDQGTLAEAFINYEVNRHLKFTIRCDNVLDQTFSLGVSGSNQNDPVYPRTWFFSRFIPILRAVRPRPETAHELLL